MLSRLHGSKHADLKLDFQTATGQGIFTFTLIVASFIPHRGKLYALLTLQQ